MAIRQCSMRLKTLGNQMRVYMNPNDYETVLDSAETVYHAYDQS